MPTNNSNRLEHTTDSLAYEVERAVFFDHPAMDALVTSFVAMGSEVWSAQRRIKVLESVLKDQGVSLDLIDEYQPTDEETTAWRTERDQFIRRVYGALEQTSAATAKYGPGMDSLRQEG
ncbi:MAG: hypothetical protein ABJ205_11405 [Erythrobacter sp.]|uniref:hypothetical protein n=1 Tax=Erythrobacter sp. TaxID=1042 RepID=UPI003266AC96